jgi:hypothetical protein
MYAHLNEPPPRVGAVRPDVPPHLERLVLDLLAKEVDQRPSSAGAVAAFLRTEGQGTPLPPPVAPPPGPPPGPPPVPLPVGFPAPGLPPHGPSTNPGTAVMTAPHPAGRQSPRLLIAAGAGVAALVAAGALAVLVLPSGGGTSAGHEPADPAVPATTASSTSAAPSTPVVHKIVYKVTGSVSPLSVMVMPPDGGMTRQSVKPPWTAKYQASRFTMLSISGNTGIESGTVHCSITLDGKVVQERSAKGQFASVSCMYQGSFYDYGSGMPSIG